MIIGGASAPVHRGLFGPAFRPFTAQSARKQSLVAMIDAEIDPWLQGGSSPAFVQASVKHAIF